MRGLGINVAADLPVGKNLQDHLGAYMTYTRPQPGPFHGEMRFDRMAMSMVRAYLFGTGPGTVVPGGLHAFVKTRPELSVPDIEFMFRGTSHDPHLWFPLLRPAYLDGYGIRPTLLHPDSRGEILLASSDPLKPPRIVYNFFTAPNDLPTLREGFKLARELAFHKALDPFAARRSVRARRSKPTPRSMAGSKKSSSQRTTLRHLRDGPGRGPRTGYEGARHRGPACLRCLRDAGPRFSAHQRMRDHDGRQGLGHHSRQNRIAAGGGGVTNGIG